MMMMMMMMMYQMENGHLQGPRILKPATCNHNPQGHSSDSYQFDQMDKIPFSNNCDFRKPIFQQNTNRQ